jgi:4-hydroxyacetophenone monooxygenase
VGQLSKISLKSILEIKRILISEKDENLKKIILSSIIKIYERTKSLHQRKKIVKNFNFLKKYNKKNNNRAIFKNLGLNLKFYDLYENELGISEEKLKKIKKSKKKILIIGGGISGIASYYYLKKYFSNIKIFEKNKKLGGTWLKNNYPGARVDVANRMYCFSFNQNYQFKNIYSTRKQMFDYINNTINKIKIKKKVLTSTEVKEIKFKNFKWHVLFLNKKKYKSEKFDYLVCATGQLSIPKKIKIKNYTGKIIHPYFWNNNINTNNKKILMIGNAASGVQIATKIYKKTRILDVLCRSNNWFHYVKHYKEKTPDKLNYYFNKIKFFNNFFRLRNWDNTDNGYLKQCSLNRNGKPSKSALIFKEKLKNYFKEHFGNNYNNFLPVFPPGSKRILLDDGEWASLLKEKKINLIFDEISKAKNKYIYFKKNKMKEYDYIISATGYETPSFFSKFDVIVNNTNIKNKFYEKPLTYCGIFSPELPNLVFNYGPNTNGVVNGNTIFFSETQSKFYSKLLFEFSKKSGAFLIKNKIATKLQNIINNKNNFRTWSFQKVNSWYKNKQGLVTQNWPLSLKEYWTYCKKLKINDFNFTK